MTQCDDIFQELQDLQQKRQRLIESRGVLWSSQDGPPNAGDGNRQGPRQQGPEGDFVFRGVDKDGNPLEADMSALDGLVEGLDDEAGQEAVKQSLGERAKPIGAEGQFTNFGQLIDRLGLDGAEEAAQLIRVITGSWEKVNPADFARVTDVNSRDAVVQRIADAYAEAGVRLDTGTLTQAIARDAAPFMTILARQTRLQVFSAVARQNLAAAIDELSSSIVSNAGKADPAVKSAFVDAGAKAIFAERSAALSRRVSGQLLQQLQVDPLRAPGIAGRVFEEELKREAAAIFDGHEDMFGPDGVMGRVILASDRGMDGLRDLAELSETLRTEGIEPNTKLDKDWKQLWRRQARAYAKDSMLFNGNTQLISSWLANQAAYWGEGYRMIFRNAQDLRGQIIGDGVSKSLKQLLPGKVVEGFNLTWTAGELGRAAAADAWGAVMRDFMVRKGLDQIEKTGDLFAPTRSKWGLWDEIEKMADTEGAGAFNPTAVDERGGGQLSLEDQYTVARYVLYGDTGKPKWGDSVWGKIGSAAHALKEEDWWMVPMAIRDKAFVSLRLLSNHLIEKSTGKKLPLTTALQTLSLVDQKSGLRAFMSMRANKLLLDNMKDPQFSALTWDERKAMVRKQLDDQLYQMTPTDQNIADWRTEMYVGADEVTDDQVGAMIAMSRAGGPVLLSKDQQDAMLFATEVRMQMPPQSGWLKALDEGVMKARENPYIDALLPYWRSPMSSALWNIKFASPPIMDTVDLVFRGGAKGGKPATDEEVAKVVATWYAWLGLLSGFGVIQATGALRGNGPTDPKDRQQWRAAGNNANTIGNVPVSLGQVPIANTLFLYKDLQTAVERGELSAYDAKNAFMGLWQVFAGQVLRETGFKQFAEIYDAISTGDPDQWSKAFGFMLNGQTNPLSGGVRQVERLAQLGGGDLYRPRLDRPADASIKEQAGVRHPWYDIRDKLQALRFNMQPSMSGQPVRETDYLGRSLRMFPGIFQGEAPVGMPGLWSSPVHETLERIGMLQPPRPLMDGRLRGLPMTTDLEREFAQELIKPSPTPMSDHETFAKRMLWRVPNTNSVVDLSPLLDRITAGKTQYEALNALFKSDTWKEWQKDPASTTDPKLSDAPRPEIQQRIGPSAIKLLGEYYAQLATEAIERSSTPAARDWQKLLEQKALRSDPDRAEQQAERLQLTVR